MNAFQCLISYLYVRFVWESERRTRPEWDAMGLDWKRLEVDSAGSQYFDLGEVRLYPWTWHPIADVIDVKTGQMIEENTNLRPGGKYYDELLNRYALPGRHKIVANPTGTY